MCRLYLLTISVTLSLYYFGSAEIKPMAEAGMWLCGRGAANIGNASAHVTPQTPAPGRKQKGWRENSEVKGTVLLQRTWG